MTHLLLFTIGHTALSSCFDKPCHAGTHYCLTTDWKSPTKQSGFKIIFGKLANFEANIFKAQGDFLKSFAQSAGSVEKMLQWRSTTQYNAVVEGKAMIFEH